MAISSGEVARAVVAASVALLLLSGFAGLDQGPASVGLGASAAPPSTLRIGSVQEPDTMNPFVGVLDASYSIYASVYDLLVGIGDDLTPVPQLATNWTVSADRLTWTFNLFPGVVWHDDTATTPRPFTSADVKFTYEYIQTCRLSLFLSYVGDPTDPNVGYIRSITTPTPTQVVITTNKPKANMLSLYIPIVPQHIWSQVSCAQAKQGYKNEPPIGTGMYTFVEWRKGQFLRLALNNRYHFLQPLQDYVDEIIYRFYNTDVAVLNDFLAGNLDATNALQPQQFLSLPLDIDGGTTNPDADPDPDITKFVQDMIDLSMLGFCSATDAVLAQYGASGDRHWLALNLTIRQAVANAINKTRLVDTIWSGLDAATGQNRSLARAGSSLIPPATPFWHYNVTAQEELGFSLAQGAARLSDPAGDGWTTTDGNPPNAVGSNLDPNAANNRDGFGDTNGDGVRDVIDMAYVAAQNPEAAPQLNRAVRGSAANRLTFGLWIINSDVEAQAATTEFVPKLASIGIEAVVKKVSSAQMLALSLACDYDWYIWGWIFDVDPDFGLSVLSTGQILGWQDAWYSNATYDAWYVQQQQEVDLNQRQTIVRAMQRLVYRDQPYNVLWYPSLYTVVRSDRFTNWGDWATHSGLGLTGYGNVFTMLRVTPVFTVSNQCPTVVLIDAPVQPRVVDVGSLEAFNGTALDPEGDALTWTWVWADGNTTLVNTSAGNSSLTVIHAWSLPGDYNITLTVTDALCGGSTSSLPVWVQVVPLPPVVGWIAGTVTDASAGAPIPGATVSVSPGGASVTTAFDGTYNVTVAPGTYNVSSVKALYVPLTLSGTVLANATTMLNFPLLPAPGWVAGTVTDAFTGAPIGSGVVTVMPGGVNTTTAVDGTYNVSVSPGTYTVTASRAFYTPSSQSVTVTSNATSTANFALSPGAGWIAGAVTDAATGSPIAGATVVVMPGGASVTTAFDGTYNVTVAPGMYNATASKALYVSQSQALSVTSNATTSANFPLSPAPGWIAGTVTDATTGFPLAGVLVTAAPGGANATTALDGTYNVSVAPDTYTVTASKPTYAPSSRSAVVASNATTTVDFQLAPAPGWIGGRVADVATGSPLGGVSLKVVDGTGTEYPGVTAADGTYNLTVPPGTYTVIVVLAPGYVNQTLSGAGVLTGQTTTVDFQLQREMGWLAGRVTDTATGAPIADATVVVMPGGASATTAFDGTYNVSVAPGTYTVTASMTLFVPQSIGATVVHAMTTAVNFPLSPQPGWIAGTITDAATGARLGGVTLKAVDASGQEYAATTAADGTYNLTLPARTYSVIVISAPGFVNQTRASIGVVSGQTAQVNFQLQPERGWIAGTVTDAATVAPLAGVALKAVSATGTEYPGSTSAVGAYNLTVPPGTYTVIVVLAAGYVNQTRAGVAVANAQAIQIGFALLAQSGWIAGQITDAASNAPLAGVVVRAVDAAGREYIAVTAADGSYNITLPPGTYTLRTDPVSGYSGQSRAGVNVTSGRGVQVELRLEPVAPTSGIGTEALFAGGAIAAIVAAGLALLLLRRRKRETPSREGARERVAAPPADDKTDAIPPPPTVEDTPEAIPPPPPPEEQPETIPPPPTPPPPL